MCGIAGIVTSDNFVLDHKSVQAMGLSIMHRGPDDCGYASWSRDSDQICLSKDPVIVSGKHLGMVHRRLSILDLSDAGWQPMQSKDGRYAIVFNGEVYNFLELRNELQCLGHKFVSNSDTEVVLAAWDEWGLESASRFIGMFAFAVFDSVDRTISLVRDPFGIKPLYYGFFNQGLAFASEIPAIVNLAGFDKSANKQSVFEFLRYGYTDRSESTLFENVHRVPAGACVKFEIDHVDDYSITYYWKLSVKTRNVRYDEAVERVKQIFLDSVSLHLRSDVPVGIALSGGIDSTSILGAASLLGDVNKLHAFSFISSDQSQSEEKWIDLAASYYGVDLNKIHISNESFSTEIERVIAIQGEPFATTGMFAQERVFDNVRSTGIKVTLDGQGADEILAGYPTYLAAALADSIQHLDIKSINYMKAGGLSCMYRAMGMILPAGLQGACRYLVGEETVPKWLNSEWLDKKSVVTRWKSQNRKRDRLHDRLEETVTDLSLPALLRYADRNSMAHSVESRVPFLTTKFAEYVLSLPSEYLISQNGTTKAIFRDAMRGIVPDEILDRKDKVGFSVPEATWLKGSIPWVRSQLNRYADSLPMLNHSNVLKLVDNLERYGTVNNSIIWRCLNLGIWAEVFGVNF